MSFDNISRNKLEACLHNRPEPTLSTDKLIAIPIPAHRYRLYYPIFNNGVCQLFESSFIKFLAGLKRICTDFFDRQTTNSAFLCKFPFLIL